MQYFYHPKAAASQLILTGENHRYLFKVRRHRAGESLYLRNLQDDILYCYQIKNIDKKEALLSLEAQEERIIIVKKQLHIGWCMIDPKNIEKVLPVLNEIGVAKITFIYCERSQKQFRPDFNRWQKILLNSSQQCGRSRMMQLEQEEGLLQFIQKYPKAHLLDFAAQRLSVAQEIETVIIGCEGGMAEAERALFDANRTVGLDTPMILRSESAALSAATLLLL